MSKTKISNKSNCGNILHDFCAKKTPKTYQITIILRVISHHMSKISWHIGSRNSFNTQNFHISLTKNIRSISLTGRMDSLIKCSQNDLA